MNQEKAKRLRMSETIKLREDLFRQLLDTIPGENPNREGLKDTPLRMAAMWDELFAGYQQDPAQMLRDAMFSDIDSHDLVVVKDIPFYSLCEHHLVTFFGTVTIAYIPQDGKIVGLSKLPRIVDAFAKRLQVQEALGKSILECIQTTMEPFGVAVIVKARHMCVESRGIQKTGAETITSAMNGIFKLDDKARNELMQLIR